MKVDVSNLGVAEVLKLDFEHEIAIPKAYLLNSKTALINVTGTITRFHDFLALEAQVSSIINKNCDRCLTPVDVKIDFGLFERFSEANPDAEDIWRFNGQFIDLTEPLEVNLFVNFPMHTLCTEDCLGLCRICGANLNRDDCNCKNELDDRFSELQNFFSQNE